MRDNTPTSRDQLEHLEHPEAISTMNSFIARRGGLPQKSVPGVPGVPTPATLLMSQCLGLGILLRTEAGRLFFDAPRGALDPLLRGRLAEYKAELIRLLADPPPPPVDDFDAALTGFERRAATIRERQGVPRAEAERLAYRELVGPSWGELSKQRWGPATADDGCIIIDRPDRAGMRAALEAAAAHPDAYARAEREAIRAEAEPDPPAVL